MPANHKLAADAELAELTGKSVLHFFPALCSLRREITGLRFDTYKPVPGLNERLANMLSATEQELRDAAVALRDAHGLPFWDGLLATSMQRGALSERFIETALAHDGAPDEQHTTVPREALTAARIQDLIAELPPGYGFAACSRVWLASNQAAHIPMLDFRCPCSEENAKAIERMLASMGCAEGVLVQSGRSYHFYGTSLLSQAQWVEFLGRALLFAPIVDSRFIGHRLVDGQCRLKVMDPRNGLTPRISHVFFAHV